MKTGYINANYYELEQSELERVYELRLPFQVADTFSITGKTSLIEIDSLYVNKECRDKGYGSEILRQFCQDKDDEIIIVGAGAHAKEYDVEPTDDEYEELFIKLNRFYPKNNFENVTHLFGTYDGSTKQTFILKNKAGLQAIEDRKQQIKEFNDNLKKSSKGV